MAKKIVIIGAGVAGLSAGIYAKMNGFDTEIYELHIIPGGVCTAWKRGGYLFDGCIHWLVGSSPASLFHEMWQELGVIKNRKIYNHDEFTRITIDKKTLVVFTDADRFEKHLLELAPEDESVIKEFTGAIRKFASFDMPSLKPFNCMGLIEKAKALMWLAPYIPGLMKWAPLSIQKFSTRFKNDFLRKAFPAIFDLDDFPMIAVILTIGWMHAKTGGVPAGGSLPFAMALQERFEGLGGVTHFGKRVKKITVENGKAKGIVLEDGTEIKADVVISAADGHSTLYSMLDGKFVAPDIAKHYENPVLFPPILQISLGVKRDMQGIPRSATFVLPEPIEIAGKKQHALSLLNYSFDPSFAPQGHTVLASYVITTYEYWEKLYTDKVAYKKEKERALEAYIGFLETIYPGIRADIEVIDVATPMTYLRYTANWRGSWEGWSMTTKTLRWKFPNRLPGLSDFYMIGQWLTPGGGLPPVAKAGRDVIMKLCLDEGKEFIARKA